MPIAASSNERSAVLDEVQRGAGCTLERRALADGDFHVFDKQNRLRYIVERKTWSDLRGSFARGQHLRDQIARGESAARDTGARYLLLVENPARHWSRATGPGVSDKCLLALLARLQLAGLPVVWSENPRETGCALAWMNERAERESADAASPGAVLGSAVPVASARARGATRSDIHTAMLACVPGVSFKKAALLLRGGTLQGLLSRGPESLRKERGIGRVLAERLADVLWGSSK